MEKEEWGFGGKAMRFVMWILIAFIPIAVGFAAEIKNGDRSKTCIPEKSLDFSDWKSWIRINPKPQLSVGHSNVWVEIYVNKLAKDIYLNAQAPYPPCAKIVKVSYKDRETKQFIDLTAMFKMPAGYDSENNDWWYATFDQVGVHAEEKGRLANCITCHKKAARTDFLFSNEVMKATRGPS